MRSVDLEVESLLKINEDASFSAGYFLGLDTSCYTTSLGLVDAQGNIIEDLRRILNVKLGERGLRQSEALFQHLKNIPELVEAIAPFRPLLAVAYSSRPRPVKDSYLPVFLAGASFARTIAASAPAPLMVSSHQEGHIRAAMEGSGLTGEEFLGMHLSGGTTELLYIKKAEEGFSIELMGGTTDLHAGQMVDRIGVALGLPFPAGPHLERLAAKGKGSMCLPVAAHGLTLSFSGPTSAALRLLKQQSDPEGIALAVLNCLVESVFSLLKEGVKVKASEPGSSKVLIFGGVASNAYLRRELQARLSSLSPAIRVYYGTTELSSDNAVGVALVARDYFLKTREKGGVSG
ncbi:MAG TPA: O-sialoglycoprotein endopeptidase [Firmicutes bacterium]|nr:O-sialoglycoprotein endopeptidase [Bacillota bacterium]